MSHMSITLPNSEQFSLHNKKGQEHVIQVSWPIHWTDRGEANGPTPIIYLTDGNSVFLTATEAAWRRAPDPHFAGGGIVVAIGYPLTGKVFDLERRKSDLKPVAKDTKPGSGEADAFIDFIVNEVRPAVKARFPGLSTSREALYGHSLGGLFALHALFTRSLPFDCYIASSPSIWHDDRAILDSAKSFIARGGDTTQASRPILMLSAGSWEQHPPRWANEPIDKYQTRKNEWDDLKMASNVSELYEMLKGCSKLKAVTNKVYEGEEHLSVVACSVNRSLTEFFEDWETF